jgi:hypothetical protein
MVVFVSYMLVSLLIDSLILGIRARADGENRNFSPASVRKIGAAGRGRAAGRPAGVAAAPPWRQAMDGSSVARFATLREHLCRSAPISNRAPACHGGGGDPETSAPERLTAADFDECVDFCDLVFAGNGGEHASRGGFSTLLPQLYQPDERMAWQWAIRKRGALVAVVGVFPRTWRVMGESLKVGGIGGVGTHARLSRGSGHMRTLMNHCVATMRADGCHMAVLGGQRQRYQHYGFEKAGLEVTFSISAKNVRYSVDFGDGAAPAERAAALKFEPLDASQMTRAAEVRTVPPVYATVYRV